MTVKEALHTIVDDLSDEDAERLLCVVETEFELDELTEGEIEAALAGKAEIERGEFVTLEEFRATHNL